MNSRIITIVVMLSLALSSCELVGDIFKAGVWAGALLVIGIIALVVFIAAKLFGGGKGKS